MSAHVITNSFQLHLCDISPKGCNQIGFLFNGVCFFHVSEDPFVIFTMARHLAVYLYCKHAAKTILQADVQGQSDVSTVIIQIEL